MEDEKRLLIKRILSPKAFERLSNIKMVKPQVAEQLENYLIQLFQAGKINKIIEEKEMITILENLNSKKRFRLIR